MIHDSDYPDCTMSCAITDHHTLASGSNCRRPLPLLRAWNVQTLFVRHCKPLLRGPAYIDVDTPQCQRSRRHDDSEIFRRSREKV